MKSSKLLGAFLTCMAAMTIAACPAEGSGCDINLTIPKAVAEEGETPQIAALLPAAVLTAESSEEEPNKLKARIAESSEKSWPIYLCGAASALVVVVLIGLLAGKKKK